MILESDKFYLSFEGLVVHILKYFRIRGKIMIEENANNQGLILGSNKRIIILNTIIDVLDANETIDLVEQYIITKTPLHIMGVNAAKINELNQSDRMRNIVNSCGIINADGASVILASRFLGKPLPERVAGVDLMEKLIALSEEKRYSIYLLGAKEDIVKKTVDTLTKKYPKLIIKGFRNGYFAESDWPCISENIKQSQPDLVFVGITSPTKEFLIEYLQTEGHVSAFMGVGGSFDVISGSIPRAPLWMQKCNLEWFFRMIQEPKRLFRRYFFGNLLFVKNIVREKFLK